VSVFSSKTDTKETALSASVTRPLMKCRVDKASGKKQNQKTKNILCMFMEVLIMAQMYYFFRFTTHFLQMFRIFAKSNQKIMAKTKKNMAVQGIEIANPLYDAVFKHLMANNKVAAYFIESFIGEKIESLTLTAQECPVLKWVSKFDETEFKITPADLERLKKITVIRLDFVATIKTDTGEYKKVLIEIQKVRETDDVVRFRHYLAEHYKRKDTISKNDKSASEPLPIISIYLLGFNLPESDAIVFRVGRVYYDMIEKKEMNVKISLAEYLTHDCYMVQLGRITGKTQTRLEKLLSVFEQRYFIDKNKKTAKKYPHANDDKMVRLMLEILEHVNANPDHQREIELEWSSLEILNKMVFDKDKKIKEIGKALIEKEKALLAKEKALVAKDEENAELRRQLAKLHQK
jgi:hypothetical protein